MVVLKMTSGNKSVLRLDVFQDWLFYGSVRYFPGTKTMSQAVNTAQSDSTFMTS